MGNLDKPFDAYRAQLAQIATRRAQQSGTLLSPSKVGVTADRATGACAPVDGIAPGDGGRWYVVEVEFGQEMGATARLIGRRDVKPYCPTEWVKVTRHRRRVKVWEIRPMLIGYTFVRLRSDDAYHRVRRTRGVADFLKFDDRDAIVSEADMAIVVGAEQTLALRALAKMGKVGVPCQPGDEVRVFCGDNPLSEALLQAEADAAGRTQLFLGAIRVRVKNPHAIDIVATSAA